MGRGQRSMLTMGADTDKIDFETDWRRQLEKYAPAAAAAVAGGRRRRRKRGGSAGRWGGLLRALPM